MNIEQIRTILANQINLIAKCSEECKEENNIIGLYKCTIALCKAIECLDLLNYRERRDINEIKTNK